MVADVGIVSGGIIFYRRSPINRVEENACSKEWTEIFMTMMSWKGSISWVQECEGLYYQWVPNYPQYEWWIPYCKCILPIFVHPCCSNDSMYLTKIFHYGSQLDIHYIYKPSPGITLDGHQPGYTNKDFKFSATTKINKAKFSSCQGSNSCHFLMKHCFLWRQ